MSRKTDQMYCGVKPKISLSPLLQALNIQTFGGSVDFCSISLIIF